MTYIKRGFGAFGLIILSIVVGNLLGTILTAVWGWQGLSYDKPGGVALAAIQGILGGALIIWSIEKFFDRELAETAFKMTAYSFALLIIVFAVAAISMNMTFSILIKWNTLATLASFAGMIYGSKLAS